MNLFLLFLLIHNLLNNFNVVSSLFHDVLNFQCTVFKDFFDSINIVELDFEIGWYFLVFFKELILGNFILLKKFLKDLLMGRRLKICCILSELQNIVVLGLFESWQSNLFFTGTLDLNLRPKLIFVLKIIWFHLFELILSLGIFFRWTCIDALKGVLRFGLDSLERIFIVIWWRFYEL